MKLRETLQKAWENRDKIAEGFYNKYLSLDPEIKAEADRRKAICEGCEYYDATGTKEIIVVKNQPGCLLCGCNTSLLVNSMSSQCSAPKIGLKARWEAIMTEEQSKEIEDIKYKAQFKKNG